MVAITQNPKWRWVAMEDRPREKLTKNGPVSLTNVELLAVLLGTGTSSDHVMDIAESILSAVDNDIGRLVAMSIEDLKSMHGIGHARAVRFKAVMEFARRAQLEKAKRDLKIVTSKDAFRALAPDLGDLPHEEFWMLLLNQRSKVIDKMVVSRGGIASTIVDPRIVYSKAIELKASSLIVAHNHPSGNLNPSQADIDLTKKLVAVGKIADIQLVDHLIISGNNYCSFADSGLM
ncbi:MAG: DNA repair protein RadC [Bacteroidota bacterium]